MEKKYFLDLVIFMMVIIKIGVNGAKSHSGQIDIPKNQDEKLAIEEITTLWNTHGAVGGKDSGVNIFERKFDKSRSAFRGAGDKNPCLAHNCILIRLDMQGVEKNEKGATFERYSVQIDSRTFNSVHIQRDVRFGVALIRDAFRASTASAAHVFLTLPNTAVKLPDDGKQYDSLRIERTWDGVKNNVVALGVQGALQRLKKFHLYTGP